MASPPLTIFRGAGTPGHFSWSPFAAKLEARLRFDSVPYKVLGGSPKTAPRGKIPWVQLSSGEKLSDTTSIARRLVADDVLTDLNANLTPLQRAHDVAVRALLEDKAYFYGVREKWCDNFETMRENSLALVPWPIRWVVGYLARGTVVRMLHGQGAGRLTGEEVEILRAEAWESLDALLVEAKRATRSGGDDDKKDTAPFWLLGGEGPSEADATIFAFVASALVCDA